MPRLPTETYHHYKQRVIDPVGPTFCAAKWYNATIWLGNGKTVSCHHPVPHQINIQEIKTNPSAIHNTSYKKSLRKMMLEGNRPEECSYCWRVEDLGKDHISDRTFKTVIYQDEDLKKIATDDWDTNVNLKTLEIAFDRTCNFSCSYCNPTYSTTWTKDIKRDGEYKDLVGPHRMAYMNDGTWADTYKDKNANPYIQAFWEWWPELSVGLEELRITGGEPLMSDDVWKLLDMFKTQDISHIRLAINSNLGGKPELITRLIESSQHVKHLDIYTSCEATGLQAEYIRDGLDYNQWKLNVERVLRVGNIERFHIMFTINALCLFSITELMDQVLVWKKQFNRPCGLMGMSFNMLSYPSFQSFHVLPGYIKTVLVAKLSNWVDTHENDVTFEMHERESFARLLSMLSNSIDNPPNPIDVQDFKKFYTQYDARRHKSIQVFPSILTEWFNTIKSSVIPIAVAKE